MTPLPGRTEQLLSWFDGTCNRQVEEREKHIPNGKNATGFGGKEDNIIFKKHSFLPNVAPCKGLEEHEFLQ